MQMNKKFSFVFYPAFLFVPVLLFFNSLFAIPENQFSTDENHFSAKKLIINLISSLNGKGLEADQNVLAEAIEKLGHSVKKLTFEDAERSPADINIFFQDLVPQKFAWAKLNWFVPNLEWYTQNVKLLEKVDLILCRTHQTEFFFQKLHKSTYYLGFISIDCYQIEFQKDFSHFFHLAGESEYKGTNTIKNIWLNNPSLPFLTVIKYPSKCVSKSNLECIPFRVPVNQLRLLQNGCGIHLCPSETEGFGHYIMEAMSTASVVVTTNAPPMNEFIQDPRCLVAYTSSQPFRLGTCYYVDPIELENKVKFLAGLPATELEAMGLNNRALYLQKKREFYEKLEELLWLFSYSLVL